MRRCLSAALVAVLAALAIALPSYAASAILIAGQNSPVAPGDVLWGELKGSAIFQNTGNSNKITCTQSRIDATDSTNGPTTATLSITSWTFGSCTTNSGATVNTVTFDNLPYNMTVTVPGNNNVTINPGSSVIIHLTIVIKQIFQITCKYKVHDSSGDLFGTTSNVDNSLTFTNQQFDLESGPVGCSSSLNFSAAYTLTDHTQSGGLVFVN